MERNFDIEIVNLSDVGKKRPHNEDSTASTSSPVLQWIEAETYPVGIEYVCSVTIALGSIYH